MTRRSGSRRSRPVLAASDGNRTNRFEIRLEDRFEHQLQHGLHDPVSRGRDPQPAQLARCAFGIITARTGDGAKQRVLSSARSAPNIASPSTMERGAILSIPAEREPLLPRTRFHATTRNDGSYTRLYKSSKQRSGSPAAQQCSLVCITSTRRSASSTEGQPTVRRYSPATPRSLQLLRIPLEPFAMYTAFLCSDYYELLRPIPAASIGNGSSRRSCWPHDRLGQPGWFPRSLLHHSTREVPNYAPAASPRLRRRHSPWPQKSATSTDPRVPPTTNSHAIEVRAATQPVSVRLELVEYS